MKSLILLLALGVCIVSTCGCLGFFSGYTEKAQEYTSADYSIEQYKFFIDKYNAIRQMGAMIKNQNSQMEEFTAMYNDPKTWSRTQQENFEELRFTRNGYIQQYNKLAADYNARMRDLTTNQMWMKPQNYPSSIDLYSDGKFITTNDEPLELPKA